MAHTTMLIAKHLPLFVPMLPQRREDDHGSVFFDDDAALVPSA